MTETKFPSNDEGQKEFDKIKAKNGNTELEAIKNISSQVKGEIATEEEIEAAKMQIRNEVENDPQAVQDKMMEYLYSFINKMKNKTRKERRAIMKRSKKQFRDIMPKITREENEAHQKANGVFDNVSPEKKKRKIDQKNEWYAKQNSSKRKKLSKARRPKALIPGNHPLADVETAQA